MAYGDKIHRAPAEGGYASKINRAPPPPHDGPACHPAPSGEPWEGYYISAYGIAVKHGYSGTEEEWLASLHGRDGRDGIQPYTHRQQSASAEWTINHNLHRYPSVTVVDSADTQVVGNVKYISEDTLKVTFSAPFSGSAYLN